MVVQRLADGPDLAVHHGRRRRKVSPGLHVGNGGLAQQLQGLVIVYPVIGDHAAVAVVGVLAHANVGDHHHAGMVLLDHADSFLHDSLGIVALSAQRVLLGRQPEQQDGGDAQLRSLANVFRQHVQGHLELAGHGLDGVFDALSVAHEDGIDEFFDRQPGLPCQVAHGLAAAQTPHS